MLALLNLKMAIFRIKRIIKTSVENAFRIVVFTNQNKMDLINQFNCNPENCYSKFISFFAT